jgi:hypothetical protein
MTNPENFENFSVVYLANFFAKSLSHGCAIRDEDLLNRIKTLDTLQQAWKFFGSLNNEDSIIHGICGWEESRGTYDYLCLTHVTGSGRLRIVANYDSIVLVFTAGTGDCVLELSIYPYNFVSVGYLNRDLVIGREDRLNSLFRFNDGLNGWIGDRLSRNSDSDSEFLFNLIGGSERFASEAS